MGWSPPQGRPDHGGPRLRCLWSKTERDAGCAWQPGETLGQAAFWLLLSRTLPEFSLQDAAGHGIRVWPWPLSTSGDCVSYLQQLGLLQTVVSDWLNDALDVGWFYSWGREFTSRPGGRLSAHRAVGVRPAVLWDRLRRTAMQDQTFNVATLEQLVFVNVQISCWSGKKTLTPEDLGLDRDTLPPETLVSLGDKQLIHPDTLRAFTSIRSAARRHCLAVGTRFLGGYAVPAQKAQGLLDRLTTLGQRYQQAKTAFLATYDQKLADWTAQQPSQWQKLIQDALVPATYVGGRLQFQVQVLSIIHI